jgi:AcrR family transcriptional regulator
VDDDATTDGRVLRRQRNRELVVDAMLELIDEHQGVEPSVEQVVERSGLSERSIFRYFDGLDDLRLAVITRNFERVERLFAVDHVGEGPLAERVGHFVETRLRLCERMAGVGRVSRRNAASQPVLAAEVARFRELLGRQVRAHFEPEFSASLSRADATDLEVVIEVLVSFDAWDLMTSGYGRSRTQIRRSWNRALLAVLSA